MRMLIEVLASALGSCITYTISNGLVALRDSSYLEARLNYFCHYIIHNQHTPVYMTRPFKDVLGFQFKSVVSRSVLNYIVHVLNG